MPTLEELSGIIAKITRCRKDEISLQMELKDVKADSLHWLQIIIGVENAFGIEIDVEKMRDFTTIGELVEYIDSLTKQT